MTVRSFENEIKNVIRFYNGTNIVKEMPISPIVSLALDYDCYIDKLDIIDQKNRVLHEQTFSSKVLIKTGNSLLINLRKLVINGFLVQDIFQEINNFLTAIYESKDEEIAIDLIFNFFYINEFDIPFLSDVLRSIKVKKLSIRLIKSILMATYDKKDQLSIAREGFFYNASKKIEDAHEIIGKLR